MEECEIQSSGAPAPPVQTMLLEAKGDGENGEQAANPLLGHQPSSTSSCRKQSGCSDSSQYAPIATLIQRSQQRQKQFRCVLEEVGHLHIIPFLRPVEVRAVICTVPLAPEVKHFHYRNLIDRFDTKERTRWLVRADRKKQKLGGQHPQAETFGNDQVENKRRSDLLPQNDAIQLETSGKKKKKKKKTSAKDENVDDDVDDSKSRLGNSFVDYYTLWKYSCEVCGTLTKSEVATFDRGTLRVCPECAGRYVKRTEVRRKLEGELQLPLFVGHDVNLGAVREASSQVDAAWNIPNDGDNYNTAGLQEDVVDHEDILWSSAKNGKNRSSTRTDAGLLMALWRIIFLSTEADSSGTSSDRRVGAARQNDDPSADKLPIVVLSKVAAKIELERKECVLPADILSLCDLLYQPDDRRTRIDIDHSSSQMLSSRKLRMAAGGQETDVDAEDVDLSPGGISNAGSSCSTFPARLEEATQRDYAGLLVDKSHWQRLEAALDQRGKQLFDTVFKRPDIVVPVLAERCLRRMPFVNQLGQQRRGHSNAGTTTNPHTQQIWEFWQDILVEQLDRHSLKQAKPAYHNICRLSVVEQVQEFFASAIQRATPDGLSAQRRMRRKTPTDALLDENAALESEAAQLELLLNDEVESNSENNDNSSFATYHFLQSLADLVRQWATLLLFISDVEDVAAHCPPRIENVIARSQALLKKADQDHLQAIPFPGFCYKTKKKRANENYEDLEDRLRQLALSPSFRWDLVLPSAEVLGDERTNMLVQDLDEQEQDVRKSFSTTSGNKKDYMKQHVIHTLALLFRGTPLLSCPGRGTVAHTLKTIDVPPLGVYDPNLVTSSTDHEAMRVARYAKMFAGNKALQALMAQNCVLYTTSSGGGTTTLSSSSQYHQHRTPAMKIGGMTVVNNLGEQEDQRMTCTVGGATSVFPVGSSTNASFVDLEKIRTNALRKNRLALFVARLFWHEFEMQKLLEKRRRTVFLHVDYQLITTADGVGAASLFDGNNQSAIGRMGKRKKGPYDSSDEEDGDGDHFNSSGRKGAGIPRSDMIGGLFADGAGTTKEDERQQRLAQLKHLYHRLQISPVNHQRYRPIFSLRFVSEEKNRGSESKKNHADEDGGKSSRRHMASEDAEDGMANTCRVSETPASADVAPASQKNDVEPGPADDETAERILGLEDADIRETQQTQDEPAYIRGVAPNAPAAPDESDPSIRAKNSAEETGAAGCENDHSEEMLPRMQRKHLREQKALGRKSCPWLKTKQKITRETEGPELQDQCDAIQAEFDDNRRFIEEQLANDDKAAAKRRHEDDEELKQVLAQLDTIAEDVDLVAHEIQNKANAGRNGNVDVVVGDGAAGREDKPVVALQSSAAKDLEANVDVEDDKQKMHMGEMNQKASNSDDAPLDLDSFLTRYVYNSTTNAAHNSAPGRTSCSSQIAGNNQQARSAGIAPLLKRRRVVVTKKTKVDRSSAEFNSLDLVSAEVEQAHNSKSATASQSTISTKRPHFPPLTRVATSTTTALCRMTKSNGSWAGRKKPSAEQYFNTANASEANLPWLFGDDPMLALRWFSPVYRSGADEASAASAFGADGTAGATSCASALFGNVSASRGTAGLLHPPAAGGATYDGVMQPGSLTAIGSAFFTACQMSQSAALEQANNEDITATGAGDNFHRGTYDRASLTPAALDEDPLDQGRNINAASSGSGAAAASLQLHNSSANGGHHRSAALPRFGAGTHTHEDAASDLTLEAGRYTGKLVDVVWDVDPGYCMHQCYQQRFRNQYPQQYARLRQLAFQTRGIRF
ncbi:unnamed protein product [Amoebophrya sp. A120]|nr:unnamed protein product [Amoebophrya sp. A120]|eukprot:GSA120T00006670001.1